MSAEGGLTCRACGSARVALRGHRRGEFIRREFAFHTCLDCGLLFVEPFSGFAIYDHAYYRGEGPDPYVDYEAEYRNWQATDRRLEFADLARLAEEFLGRSGQRIGSGGRLGNQRETPTAHDSPPAGRNSPAPIEWLDFGCGAGGLLKFLRERASFHDRPLRLTGHDLGSYAQLLQNRDGFRILNLEELTREPAARYDVISMIEVIEHLPDPSAPLALIARLLKPGGLLLLTTGNLEGRIPRRRGIDYAYCVPEVHVSLFNPACLARLYRRHGLEPHAVRYRGVVQFKVLKTLRHRPVRCALARLAMRFPPMVRLIDSLYGVSAMPCAVKPAASFPPAAENH